VAIGDVNGDRLPDAIIGDLNGHLFYHRNTGTGFVEDTSVLTNVALGGWSVPRLLDMDNDGDLDIATGNEAGTMNYFQNQGTVTSPNWVEVPGFFNAIDVGSNCVPTFADINNDGEIDFLAGDGFGDLHCYLRQLGSWVVNTTLFSGIAGDQNAVPAFADLDADGDLDLTLGDYDGTFSYYRNLMFSNATLNPVSELAYEMTEQVILTWDAPATGSTSPFVHYNVYLDEVLLGSTSELSWTLTNLVNGATYTVLVTAQYIAGESAPEDVSFQFTGNEDNLQVPLALQNVPNPFNRNTTISFNLKSNINTSLNIFNIKGQKVRSWNVLSKGNNNIAWDGFDDNGRFAGSGIYFYRLQTQGTTHVRKMIMK
jgi:hypothetical protein